MKHKADATFIISFKMKKSAVLSDRALVRSIICTWNLQLWAVSTSKSLNESKTMVNFGRGHRMKWDVLSRKLSSPKAEKIERKSRLWRIWDSLWPAEQRPLLRAHLLKRMKRKGRARGLQGSSGVPQGLMWGWGHLRSLEGWEDYVTEKKIYNVLCVF